MALAGPVTDCRLLDSFFAGPGSSFTTAQKTYIAGYNDYTTGGWWDLTFAKRSTATGSCNAAIPVADQWNPVTNPNGVICNSDEQIVNQVGIDPSTGFPNSPLDNVGVQYGLSALDSGAITPAQFATLNADIGGVGLTRAQGPQRTQAGLHARPAPHRDVP